MQCLHLLILTLWPSLFVHQYAFGKNIKKIGKNIEIPFKFLIFTVSSSFKRTWITSHHALQRGLFFARSLKSSRAENKWLKKGREKGEIDGACICHSRLPNIVSAKI